MFFCISGGIENPDRSEASRKTNPKSQDDCRKDRNTIEYSANHTSPEKQKNTALTAFPGSYTVEAALILPVFIMVIIALYSLFGFMIVEARLNSSLNRAGKKLACYQYALEQLRNEEGSEERKGSDSLLEELGEDITGYIVSETVVKKIILSEDEVLKAVERYIRGGADGLSFFGSRFDKEEEKVILRVSYELEVPFFSSFGAAVHLSQQSVHRSWTGKTPPEDTDEQIVYITQFGSVYHTSLSCSYLKLSIHTTTQDRIDDLRNKDGKIYYQCDLCGNKEEGTTVYYTDYGESYHCSRNCSGLKRTIQSVGISQVGSRRKCKKCERRENE